LIEGDDDDDRMRNEYTAVTQPTYIECYRARQHTGM
jgi:hypothetical protein